jgi:hypothetical protein
MSGVHPSDMELQQYVLDKLVCPADVLAHVDGCAGCQAAVAAYRLLFGELEEQPRPAFNFDASALVMEAVMAEAAEAGRAPKAEGRQRSGGMEHQLSGGRGSMVERITMAVIIALVGGIPAWLFRKNAFYVFTGVSAVFLYLMLGVALMILLLRGLAMYRKYQRRMESLQFY